MLILVSYVSYIAHINDDNRYMYCVVHICIVLYVSHRCFNIAIF